MTAPLALREAAVALGGRPVLRHLDLAIDQGDVVALLGSNGSGKSTLVRAAMGLLPLSRGQVELFGTPLPKFTSWQRVGYVPQRAAAASGVPATVWEVVASGRLARRRLFRPLSSRDRAAIDAALESVELADRRDDGAALLSGGQQQRVLIARALAGEPDLLVLDEPTAGVDLHSQYELANSLQRVAASGATVLLVAHELGALGPLIDRTVVLHDGRIVYDGEPRTATDGHTFHDHAHPERPTGPTILGSGWQL
ncbi:MAG TPA: metal ABC transporter ATP-binding protein [Nocardioidaceae bacterium]|nr:metal ABC transporter ATP-binding protein [Nocardioidaceae bacterium]